MTVPFYSLRPKTTASSVTPLYLTPRLQSIYTSCECHLQNLLRIPLPLIVLTHTIRIQDTLTSHLVISTSS